MYAVILASGSGSRLKPLGATNEPVAFRSMDDGRSLLQHSADRLLPLVDLADIVVVTDRRHGQLVREQLPEARIVPEPRNRGTAASLALAAVAVERPAEEPMLVVCADHQIEQQEPFRGAISVAGQIAGGVGEIERPLVIFGIRPIGPDDELTYLQPVYDAPLRVGDLRLYPVDSVEAKPGKGRSQQLYEAGTSYWSSGIFVWQRQAISDAIERYTPLFTLLRPAYRSEIALGAAYDRLQPVSIDEAVLVGAARDGLVLTAPLDVGWHELSA